MTKGTLTVTVGKSYNKIYSILYTVHIFIYYYT